MVNPPAGSDDHGNTLGTATAMSVGSSRSGQIGVTGDLDYFRFTLSSSRTVNAFTTGSMDTMGDLYDAGGNLLASDDDGSGTLNFRINRTLSAGTYYLRVRGYNNTATGTYNLNIQ